MYREWREHSISQNETFMCDLDDKETITLDSLSVAIPHFISEVKKVNGQPYPSKTLYDIVICVQFQLELFGFTFKLLNDQDFSSIKWSLDNLMKKRTTEGVGMSVKKAQILSVSDEEYLWSLGLLGRHNPQVLLNTEVFMIGKGFALHAGKEHQGLRSPPFNSQLELMRDDQGYWFIRYSEEIGFKTNKGGLKHRKVEPKEVDMYAIENAERCPIHLIIHYLSLLPKERRCKSMYLQPKKKFNDLCWYLDRPVGVHKLRDVVKDLCEKAKLPGHYTNHSLRSSAATSMYRGNIDEQLIQEITGHRSLAVHSYKHTCSSQRKIASNIIFGE